MFELRPLVCDPSWTAMAAVEKGAKALLLLNRPSFRSKLSTEARTSVSDI